MVDISYENQDFEHEFQITPRISLFSHKSEATFYTVLTGEFLALDRVTVRST